MNLLKKQLEQLEQGTLPEYMRKIKKQQQICEERIQASQAWAACEVSIFLLLYTDSYAMFVFTMTISPYNL